MVYHHTKITDGSLSDYFEVQTETFGLLFQRAMDLFFNIKLIRSTKWMKIVGEKRKDFPSYQQLIVRHGDMAQSLLRPAIFSC